MGCPIQDRQAECIITFLQQLSDAKRASDESCNEGFRQVVERALSARQEAHEHLKREIADLQEQIKACLAARDEERKWYKKKFDALNSEHKAVSEERSIRDKRIYPVNPELHKVWVQLTEVSCLLNKDNQGGHMFRLYGVEGIIKAAEGFTAEVLKGVPLASAACVKAQASIKRFVDTESTLRQSVQAIQALNKKTEEIAGTIR